MTREHKVTIRLTPDEHRKLRRLASLAGFVCLSHYVKRRLQEVFD